MKPAQIITREQQLVSAVQELWAGQKGRLSSRQASILLDQLKAFTLDEIIDAVESFYRLDVDGAGPNWKRIAGSLWQRRRATQVVRRDGCDGIRASWRASGEQAPACVAELLASDAQDTLEPADLENWAAFLRRWGDYCVYWQRRPMLDSRSGRMQWAWPRGEGSPRRWLPWLHTRLRGLRTFGGATEEFVADAQFRIERDASALDVGLEGVERTPF